MARLVNINQLSLYNEAALGRFSAFIAVPYNEVHRDTDFGYSVASSGFGNLSVGTKSMLLDCELLQITLQFTTYIPTASPGGGLANGHVSLEPALLFALKLTPESYFQGELAQWIPVGGDTIYQGNVFHSHFSFNHILWRFLPDVQLIGTMELSEWSVLNGNFTDPLTGAIQRAAGSAWSLGPGLRLNICNRIDFGAGVQFGVGSDRWYDENFRAEFRWRF